MSLSKLNESQTFKCEGTTTESELSKALTSINNDKSPENGNITKEYYIEFWDVLTEPPSAFVQRSLIVGELSTSQKQATIKLIEKKGKDKNFIKNWQPIYLTSKSRYETNLKGARQSLKKCYFYHSE